MQPGQKTDDLDRLLPPDVEARLIGVMARVAGVVLVALVFAIWLSLISWSVNDPSLSHATGGRISNLMGRPGAIVSDILLQLIGLASVLVLLAPLLWALELLGTERVSSLRVRGLYYPVSILLAAGALSSFPEPATWPLHHGLGGILGNLVHDAATVGVSALGLPGAGLLVALALIGTSVAATTITIGVSVAEMWAYLSRSIERHDGLRGQSWHENLRAEARRLSGSVRPEFGVKPEPELSAPPRNVANTPIQRQGPADHDDSELDDDDALETRSFLSRLFGNRSHDETTAPGVAPDTPIEPEIAPAATAFETSGRAYQSIAAQFAANFDRMIHPLAGPPSEASDGNDDDGSADIARRFSPDGRIHGLARNAHGDERMPRVGAPFDLPHLERMPSTSTMGPFPQADDRAHWRAPGQHARPAGPRGPDPLVRPSLSLLNAPPPHQPAAELSDHVLRQRATQLSEVLADYGVKGAIRDIRPGPVVTLYEFEPVRGTKSQRVISLADDIARSMSATSARAAIVPGRNVIGFELPNPGRQSVVLREMLESSAYRNSQAVLPIALGMSIGGEPMIADLARMPHLLVAGTTGSGKSVGINAMILSLIYRHAPETCRFIMIDPKMLELSVYNGIPHLLTPVVTDPLKAVAALQWAVGEMEVRYKRMASLSVRNIEAFNQRVAETHERGEPLRRTVQTGFDRMTGQPIYVHQDIDPTPMPYIVVVVDELSDLMMVAGKEIEHTILRLAQMARAAGIHLIMATQRPSVDVITGTIKANFPNRIGFKVASKIDSRTILNETGAEQLLGQGDMLWSAGSGQVHRIHGPFVSDAEVEAVARHLASQRAPDFIDGITSTADDESVGTSETSAARESGERGLVDLYDRAVELVITERKASISFLQRRLSIGYNRAANLIERMECDGVVSAASSTGRREILAASTGSDA
ncbi:MAG: DNA translocase FtsK 4TM domain-containing protein [Hyphomicrobium sp.]|nr:DNA translocase FtsK 4TM domain-containing protein [Hyphomicrobium sp.]